MTPTDWQCQTRCYIVCTLNRRHIDSFTLLFTPFLPIPHIFLPHPLDDGDAPPRLVDRDRSNRMDASCSHAGSHPSPEYSARVTTHQINVFFSHVQNADP